jgi:hypothetical protein
MLRIVDVPMVRPCMENVTLRWILYAAKIVGVGPDTLLFEHKPKL